MYPSQTGPFIEEVHKNDETLFWPDLTSAHYAHDTVQLFEELEIPFVQKKDNPPNLPQVHPIENFWAQLKELVYRGGWQADSEDQLKRQSRSCV